MLADEPTGSLDLRIGEEVQDLLFRLNEEHGIGLIVATHNRQFAKNRPLRRACRGAVGGHLGCYFWDVPLLGTLKTPLQKYWYLLKIQKYSPVF